MKVLKYRTEEGWVPLYTYILNQFAKKNANLGDLTDINAALQNLGLVGDNITSHAHDSRYLPFIQKVGDTAKNDLEALRDALNAELDKLNKQVAENSEAIKELQQTHEFSGEISKLAGMENGWYKWYGTLSGITATWIINKMDTLYVANDINDPRVMLISSDLSNWYAPYAYWFA